MKNNTPVRLIALVMTVILVAFSFAACIRTEVSINGISLDKYTIVYDKDDTDYSKRAAQYIKDKIKEITDIDLPMVEASTAVAEHEIVVGETDREISKTLDADCEGVEFAIFANDEHIALEGDYFVIAAAAYYFVKTYITGYNFVSEVPKEVSVHEPIVEDAKNFILLIGDGMGYEHTQLFDAMDVATEGDLAYSDGEDFFYGYMLPSQGQAITNSLSGLTDSAAAGTALATGYKTYNEHVGVDKDGKNLTSLTELAGSKGMSTAVMSTEDENGATPSTFSAHAPNRDDNTVLVTSRQELVKKYGTEIVCGYDYYDVFFMNDMLERPIVNTLEKLNANSKGFFLMFEEAHIDKHSHQHDADKTFNALVRFNQAIGRFMEFAFYNPDTFVLITADHETGGLNVEDGSYSYTAEAHTAVNVPVFAYGKGSELFNEKTVENTQIAKTFASFMGEGSFGDPDQPPSLAN